MFAQMATNLRREKAYTQSHSTGGSTRPGLSDGTATGNMHENLQKRLAAQFRRYARGHTDRHTCSSQYSAPLYRRRSMIT